MRLSIASALPRRTFLERPPRAHRGQQPRGDLRVGRVEVEHDLFEELIARAVGAVELRLIGGEPADQRPHAIGVGAARTRGGSSARAPGRASRARESAPGGRTICRGSAAPSRSAGRRRRAHARARAGLDGDRGQRAEALCHVVGLGELAMCELAALDRRCRRRTAPARRCASARRPAAAASGLNGGASASSRVQGGERSGVRAAERAAHGLARDVDRIRIDVLRRSRARCRLRSAALSARAAKADRCGRRERPRSARRRPRPARRHAPARGRRESASRHACSSASPDSAATASG